MAFNLAQLLKNRDIRFHESRTHYIISECPNCGGKDKIHIRKKDHLWQCWKCKGEGQTNTQSGNLYKLLVNVVGLDSFQARSAIQNENIEYVPEELSIPHYEVTESPKAEEKKHPLQITLPSKFYSLNCSEYSFKHFPEAYAYLYSRGVRSKSLITSFDLKYDQSSKRLVFPAYIDKDILVGYQGRDITNRYKSFHKKCTNYKCKLFHHFYFEGEEVAPAKCPECHGELEESFYPKAINSTNFPKTEFFFNQQNVDWTKPVVLVEGPFDCINTENSIGLLRKTLSETQFQILKQCVKNKLILYLDGDAAGTDSTISVYYKLNLFIENIEICYLDDQDDPGSHNIADNHFRLKKTISIEEWATRKNVLL